MMAGFIRHPSVKLSVIHILKSPFIRGDDEKPSFLLVNEKRVYRVMLTGFVSEKNQGVFTLDDGTGAVSVFGEFSGEPGDCARVIGRVRDYGNERIVSGEIVRRCANEWALLHRKEVVLNEGKEVKEGYVDVEVKRRAGITNSDIIREVSEKDNGEGVSVEEVVRSLGAEAESEIKRLIEEGELFEIRPGFVKVLK